MARGDRIFSLSITDAKKTHVVASGQRHYVVEHLLTAGTAVTQETMLTVERDAQLSYLLVITAPVTVSKRVILQLNGQGAIASVHGVILGTGTQSVHLTTVTRHIAPNTSARVNVHGVLTDQAEVDYDGLIKILPQAQVTDSYLASHTLLLGEQCRANAIPSLEIEANEVKCSHEATVAPIDEEDIFYLMSRGLSRTAAEQLITNGFLVPPIERFPDRAIRKLLLHALECSV